jgi:CheY-like chemotaxis protein
VPCSLLRMRRSSGSTSPRLSLERAFVLFTAASAQEAIEILESHPEICAVFTDIQMPGSMDGLQLAHVIRKRWPPTILIVSSENSFPSAYALPPHTTFIPKPYDDGALTAVVQSITSQLGA